MLHGSRGVGLKDARASGFPCVPCMRNEIGYQLVAPFMKNIKFTSLFISPSCIFKFAWCSRRRPRIQSAKKSFVVSLPYLLLVTLLPVGQRMMGFPVR